MSRCAYCRGSGEAYDPQTGEGPVCPACKGRSACKPIPMPGTLAHATTTGYGLGALGRGDALDERLQALYRDLRRDLAIIEQKGTSDMTNYGGKTISVWVDEITEWGESKGWHKPALVREKGTHRQAGPKGVKVELVLSKIALVHSELSEAVEEAREGRWTHWTTPTGKPEGFVVELADAVIRIFHIAGLMGLDLEGAIRAKQLYNEGRPFRHGGKKA